MKRNILTILLISSITWANAAKIDTVTVFSEAMQIDRNAIVITPEGYSESESYATVYLLHGWSGYYSNWIFRCINLGELADLYNVIIVCPEGDLAGWYLDSEILAQNQYGTHVGKEVVSWVDKNYSTIAQPKGRAITGLSMGGHGALKLAGEYRETFGAAGSMSGVVDLTQAAEDPRLDSLLGNIDENKEPWEKNSVANNLERLRGLPMIIDCGVSDFLYEDNIDFHQALEKAEIKHEFIARPGEHTWPYWCNSIEYQMVFFNKFFNPRKLAMVD